MKILILGAGKMGTFLTDCLCIKHEVALFDTNPSRLRFVFNTQRFTQLEEIKAFEPEICINAVTLKYTISAFESVLPFLPKNCILSDIASVKTGLQEFYQHTGMRYVSTHPMFGPTFANLSDLSTQSAIIIAESDHLGKAFFKDFYGSLQLNIFEYTFDEHDETIAYSLSIPFVSSLVFAAVMKHQEAPGTTFKKHLNVARGLLSEDDYLLSEILFNPHTANQIEAIKSQMTELQNIVEQKNLVRMQQFLTKVRTNIE
ncbi:MAG: prephenate dehydrogenase/arogenate dehydrogenase family protein [Prevotellaceae bacterium]|nr:prephenate dehydrogenase/arogenate dehydrogenase family protein [Prevotellaceae bacterium]